ncbi:MAG: TonB-dependent receptor [Bacteroidetes bacterium]|jgi:hypothetical protein|nr:TonB-dependent receptor [Bacteroidota bacterium]
MNRLLVTFIALGCSLDLISQNKLEGKINDEKGQPVPFCALALLNAGDSIVKKGNVTGENGEFIFESVSSGTYIIKSSAAGYENGFSSNFIVDSSSQIKLEPLVMKSKSVNLNEVSVTSIKQAIEFKEGMIVMNVENNPLSSGNTLFDLLKRIPGVFVDNQNNISLNGKSGVLIMLDGRLQRLAGQQLVAVLNSISSESVSKIEVMNNPPARYDAAGAGGMINIVTKKVKVVGFSGSVNGGVSKGEMWRGGADGSLNYKGKKFTVFSNYSYGNRAFNSRYIFDKKVTFNGNTIVMDEDGVQTDYTKTIFARVGADWFISDKTILGFVVSGGPGSNPASDVGINRMSGYNDLGFDHSLFDVQITDDWINPNYNINLEHTFDTLGTTLNFSADYSDFSGKRKAFSDNSFLDASGNPVLPSNVIVSRHVTGVNILTQKLDFRKTVFKKVRFEAGLKATFVNNTNDYSLERKDWNSGLYVKDSLFSNNYAYNENVYAGYFSFVVPFKKSTLTLASRIENTVVDARDKLSDFKVQKNYTNFFPNCSFEYNGIKNNSFQLGINSRINRPSYKDLNPYKSYQDNYSVTYGNPDLISQVNYNFSLGHSYKNTVFTNINYIRAQNFILYYNTQNDSTKETVTNVTNLKGKNYHAWGNVYFTKQFTQWWAFSASTYAGYMNYRGDLSSGKLDRPFFDYNFWVNNDFVLTKTWKMQVTGFFHSSSLYGVMEFKERGSLDIGIKKSFMKDALSVNLTFFDVFYTNVERMYMQFENLDVVFIKPNDTRRLWLSVNYKFGKVKVSKRQAVSNEEEKGRLGDKVQK